MGEYEDSAVKLRNVRAQLDAELGATRPPLFEPATMAGATYRPGDRVVDSVSGQGGEVVDTRFRQVIVPPAVE